MAEFKLPPTEITNIEEAKEIPWGVQHVNASQFWDKGTGKEVVVAVLDSGCDKDHPDLKGKILDGRNFTYDYDQDILNYSDNRGHGTHVAGTIAGIKDGKGIVGVAPDVKLIIGKVLNAAGGGDYDGIINGIRWATKWKGPNGEKVRVISMSLGGPYDIPELYAAVKEAVDNDIVVVCAAGNAGDGNSDTNEYAYPGAYDCVVEVGAVGRDNQLSTFSNTNNRIDLVAPGENILSSVPGGAYAEMTGTSQAAPHVAGAVALIISAYEKVGQTLTEPEIFELLLKHIKPLNGHKNGFGHGVLDMSMNAEGIKPAENKHEPLIISKENGFFINIGPFETNEKAIEFFSKINLTNLK